MVIFELRIDHFGKLQDKTIPLRAGMNVITGDNESGKTTIANFILGMIYGISPDSEMYVKYLPYDFDGRFGGAIRVLQDGVFYWIERSFLQGAPTLRVTKVSDGYEVFEPEKWMERIYGGISKEQYFESGFSTPDGLKLDEEKWSASEEKNAQRIKETEMRNHYRRAYEKLAEERKELSEKINPDIINSISQLKAQIEREEAGIESLEVLSNEKKQQWINEKTALEKLTSAVNERNHAARERLRLMMVEKKQKMESFETDLMKKAKRSNVIGTTLLVLSILAAIVSYFLICSNKWEMNFKPENLLRNCFLMFVPVLLFLIGLVLSIVTVHIRNSALKKLTQFQTAREEALKAEKEYQDYLEHREEREEHIERQSEREEDVRKIGKEYEDLLEEKEIHQAAVADLRQRVNDMAFQNREQETWQKEVDAMDLALKNISCAGKLSEERELDDVSWKATRYFSMMGTGSADQIEITKDMIMVSSYGIEKPLSGLSTTKALGVLLSARLAIFDTIDSKKLLPIIFDNVLNNFDAERLNAGMNILRSSGRQVILLSSQNRERKSL